MKLPKSHRFTHSILSLATLLLASHSIAQTHAPVPPSPTTPCKPQTTLTTAAAKPCRPKRHTDTSISLGAFSQLTIDRTSEFFGYTQQGTAPSAGTLGTFRQTFSPWLGYSVNLGYSRVSEQYRNPGSIDTNLDNTNIGSNVYETSVTYIAHTQANKRISLFGDIGPGLLTFLPYSLVSDPNIGYPYQFVARDLSVQVRPTGVFGSGIDVLLCHHLTLRAEYRGLVYNNPDFRTGDALSKRITLTSEPTISLVYHFRDLSPTSTPLYK
jgi:opacity protein-like surface antigen